MVGETPDTGNADAVAAAAAKATADAAAAAGSKPWFEGVDTDTSGYLQNRGWDKLSAKDAALAATKAHREAEKLIGAPPEQVIRLPKDANDAEGWAKVHTRLGVPADVKDYDFSTVKFTTGEVVDDEFAGELRSVAGEAKLTKDQATSVAKAVVKLIDKAEADDAAEYATKLAAEKVTLAANWGANKTANLIVAQNAAEKLGVKPDEIKALESVIGYARVMEMFRTVGSKTGEDTFINGGPGGGNTPMTKEAAQARLTSLEHDTDWQAKFEKGDVRARQEFDNLTRMISGV